MSLTPDELQTMQVCCNRTDVLARTIYGDLFNRPFSPTHKKIFDLIDDPSKQLVAIAAPRGFGKSSIVEVALCSRYILFDHSRFIVPISATANLAQRWSENLKAQLLSNPVIGHYWGNLKSEDTFSKDAWVTSNGVYVLPRGAGQQVRGQNYEGHRPSLLIPDDLETKEGVRSEQRRSDLKTWFYTDVMNSVDLSRDDWKIVYIGTILHEDSLLQNLIDSPEWESVVIEACDDNFNPVWPEFLTEEKLRKFHSMYAAEGILEEFYQDFRNQPIPRGHTAFSSKYFQYYTESEIELNENPNIQSVIIADPARTAAKGSAKTAVVGCSFDVTTRRIYYRDIVEGVMFNYDLYDVMVDMAKRLNSQTLAVEVTGLSEYIMGPLKNYLSTAGEFFHIIELNPRRSKEERAGNLAPLYRQGLVFHNKSACGGLESQLLSFPRPRYWDILDAAAHLIQVMEKCDVVMAPKEAIEHPLMPGEYTKVKRDILRGEWRCI